MTKVHEVVRVSTDIDEIRVGPHKKKFGRSNSLLVNDPLAASEIEAMYGEKVMVNEVEVRDKDNTHRYHFGYNRRFADEWERIFGNATKGKSPVSGQDDQDGEEDSPSLSGQEGRGDQEPEDG